LASRERLIVKARIIKALPLHMKVKELIKLLETDGWVLVRTRGSHRQFRHPTKLGTVTVSGKPSVDMPPGTLNSALKQAGLKS
jgi:predicted RNA binding protein YcfA (HicA-like mRNA interferase family)